MSQRLAPGPEARERISRLTAKEIQAFLDEVPLVDMRLAARVLPSVDGFRRTSASGIIRQKEILARRLSRSMANDRDFLGLYAIWRKWVGNHLPDAGTIHGMIDDVEETAAELATESGQQRAAVQARVDAVLEKLKAESQQNRCARETLEKFFTFSPFPETPDARAIISSAKAAAEVERDAAFEALPTRLAQDENEIKSIKNDVQSVKKEIGLLFGRLDKADANVRNVAESTSRAQAVADEAIASASSISNTLRKFIAAQNETSASNESAAPPAAKAEFETTLSVIDALRKDLQALREDTAGLSGAADAVRRVTEAQAQAAAKGEAQAEILKKITTALEEAKLDIIALMDARTGDDPMGKLAERIAAIESRMHEVAPAPADASIGLKVRTGGEPPALSRRANATLRVNLLRHEAGTSAETVPSFAALGNILAKTLQAQGLRKTSAQIFGEECAAAIACRQVVFLQGAFASRVARVLACVTASSKSARISMPVGLLDGQELHEATEDFGGHNEDALSAVVIEGINHSALDVSRGALLDLVDPAAAGSQSTRRRTIVLATISQGVASLPVDAEYLELGPVFDLDVLDWRLLAVPERPLSAFIPTAADEAIFRQLITASLPDEESSRVARLFTGKRNVAVEKNIVLAYRALEVLRSDHEGVTPLQSLYFGWVLPYWRALNVERDQVDSELDGGKVNGQRIDPRLAAMFAAVFPPGPDRGRTA
jgi:hypothetical protein